jgi:hypothetical protein
MDEDSKAMYNEEREFMQTKNSLDLQNDNVEYQIQNAKKMIKVVEDRAQREDNRHRFPNVNRTVNRGSSERNEGFIWIWERFIRNRIIERVRSYGLFKTQLEAFRDGTDFINNVSKTKNRDREDKHPDIHTEINTYKVSKV